MNLAELKEAYKARKLALDSAKKEEEKYKALLKDAMLEAGESDYTDEAGYRFERIVQERKSMDEEKLLAELHERNLTSCILHQGEKVLTRNQADQYERRMSTRGVQLKDVTPIDRDPDDPQDNNGGTGGTGNPQDSDLPKSGGIGSVTIEKLADTVIIEKEADTDKVVSDMVAKFKKLLPNMT